MDHVPSLTVGMKLYCSDKGFGEKHGKVIEIWPAMNAAKIKWEEFEDPMTYLWIDLKNLFTIGNCEVVSNG